MKKKDMIYGIHPIMEAIQEKNKIIQIFIQNGKRIFSKRYQRLIKFSHQKNIPIKIVSKQNFLALNNKNHQGIFAFIHSIKTFHIENLLPIFCKKKNPLLIILDKITDVRNFGSIIRTSVCAGVDAIIIPKKNTVKISSDSIKTSSGAFFKIPICQEKNIENVIKLLIKNGFKIISSTEKSNVNWYDVNFLGPTVLILGNEKKGISKKYINFSSQTIKIPSMQKGILSLNVSVACGIILYEIIRQRISNQ